jgi:tripartite-type tricarboxylate transporter receptor subunit TctC
MIVPFAAGGAADAIGRIMADGTAKHIGQPVVVDNIGGVGGATGSARVKNARPGGYTIGLGSMGTHAASMQINPKLPSDPRNDFDYLGLVSSTPNTLFVRKDCEHAQGVHRLPQGEGQKPQARTFRHRLGPHITIVLLSQLIEAEPTMVAYRGFGQTINDILSGAIGGSCDLVAAVSGHVQGGSVRALVVTVDERSPAVPDVPTANEAGLPEFKVETWTGLYAPKGSPAAVLAKLSDAIAKTLADPVSVKRLTDIGAGVPKPERQGGTYMHKLVVSEVDRWRKVLIDVKMRE